MHIHCYRIYILIIFLHSIMMLLSIFVQRHLIVQSRIVFSLIEVQIVIQYIYFCIEMIDSETMRSRIWKSARQRHHLQRELAAAVSVMNPSFYIVFQLSSVRT